MKNIEQKVVFVYENWTEEPKLMGRLYSQFIRGEEMFSFEYDTDWLKSNELNVIDPDLSFYRGPQYVPASKKQFGIFMDSEPDRWGKKLMQRRENLMAEKEGREARTLSEMDYLLGVEDFSRMGALRFALEEGGKFINDDKDFKTPPIARLRELESASREYENDESGVNDKWIKMLIAPGSSLGGARPKANVIDIDNSLWIAKFPSKNDTVDIGAWEYVVHELAKLCGLNVPDAKAIKFSKLGTTYLTKRFDREGQKRKHFASTMTLLGKNDGESKECSYLDIADFIKAYGTNVKEDLKELWKRIVFSISVKNTDDHLRNHGFILYNGGWKLSPMFDVNANPYGRALSLNIDENNNDLSFELAIKTAKYYDISTEESNEILKQISDTVKNNWGRVARENQISESSIKEMKKCFEQ